MALLYYDNLDGPDTHRPDILAKHVYHYLTPIVNYIQNAKRSIQRNSDYVSWTPIEQGELEEIFLSGDFPESDEVIDIRKDVQKRIEKGFWVRIKEEKSRPLSERVLSSFFETRWIHDSGDFREKWIVVLDSDEEMDLLCLDRKPQPYNEKQRLYLQPNTTSLQRQFQAVQELQNKPHPSQRGLYRLFESVDHVAWGDVAGIRIPSEGWYVLNSDRPGTDEQRRFVRIALGTPDFAILEGPPGSGKTLTITEIIMQFLARGKRVLLCASTHVAVDNVLERVMDKSGVFAIRVGLERNLSSEVIKLQVEHRVETASQKIIDRLRDIENPSTSQKAMLELAKRHNQPNKKNIPPFFRLMLESANLVCGTTIGVISQIHLFQSLKEGRTEPLFDVMILDEASKTTFPEFLVPAVLAKKWIVTGDTKQLSPYVDTDEIVANIRNMYSDQNKQQAIQLSLIARGRGLSRGKPSLIVTGDVSLAETFGLQCYLSGLAVAV
ncbi:MAG: AAA domain-containing protein, partial [Candidatus Thorarchaeota archaeon]